MEAIWLYGYVQPRRVQLFSHFDLKQSIDFDQKIFWSEIGHVCVLWSGILGTVLRISHIFIIYCLRSEVD